MTIKMDDALILLEQKRNRIREIRSKFKTNAIIKYELSEDADLYKQYPDEKIEEMLEELDLLYNQERILQNVITQENEKYITDIEFEGKHLKLGEVLILIRRYREELPELERLSLCKNIRTKETEKEFINNAIVNSVKIMQTEVLFNLNVVRKRIQNYKTLIDKMQSVIKDANQKIMIDYEDESFVYEYEKKLDIEA